MRVDEIRVTSFVLPCTSETVQNFVEVASQDGGYARANTRAPLAEGLARDSHSFF